MHSVTEPAFRWTFGSKRAEDVTFSHRFVVFSTWDVAHRGLWTTSEVSDAFAIGESVYQAAKEHGWALSSVKVACMLGRWDGSTGSNGRGLDSPQKKKVQEMHAERRTRSISHLARKGSAEFGKNVPWTTAYDATTDVHKSLKRVRAQYISVQNTMNSPNLFLTTISTSYGHSRRSERA